MQQRAQGRATFARHAAPSPALIGGARRAVVVRSAPERGQERTGHPLRIVFVASECAPWSKTGGLGDVMGGLPVELARRGHKVMTVSPRFDQYHDAWDTNVTVDFDGQTIRYFHAIKDGVDRVFVDHPWFLAKVWGRTGSRLYGSSSGSDFADNHKRFALFNKAAVEAARRLPVSPGERCVFVANDWHSAMVPVLIKDLYQPHNQFKDAKTAFCIHNVAFQGRMWPDTFDDLGLPKESLSRFEFEDGIPYVVNEDVFRPEEDVLPEKKAQRGVVQGEVRKYRKINWMKAGILAADKVLTVSPNYAKELMSGPEKGVELHTFLAERGVEGIVNGMDTDEWDPATDKHLSQNYDQVTVFKGKGAAKLQLQSELGLPSNPAAPLFAFIGRLEEQKGVDILLAALPFFMTKCKNAQVVVLGTGKKTLEKQVAALDGAYGGRSRGLVKFSTPLAHLITAAADFFVIPSRFEPCGLIQLHAMQYGTVPIVASTGGLVDTVKEGVTGFHIGRLDPGALLPGDAEAVENTMLRAADTYGTPMHNRTVLNCISQDLSWALPARRWEGVLEELVSGPAGMPAGAEGKGGQVGGLDATAAVSKKESVRVPVERAGEVTKPQPRMRATGVEPRAGAGAGAGAGTGARQGPGAEVGAKVGAGREGAAAGGERQEGARGDEGQGEEGRRRFEEEQRKGEEERERERGRGREQVGGGQEGRQEAQRGEEQRRGEGEEEERKRGEEQRAAEQARVEAQQREEQRRGEEEERRQRDEQERAKEGQRREDQRRGEGAEPGRVPVSSFSGPGGSGVVQARGEGASGGQREGRGETGQAGLGEGREGGGGATPPRQAEPGSFGPATFPGTPAAAGGSGSDVAPSAEQVAQGNIVPGPTTKAPAPQPAQVQAQGQGQSDAGRGGERDRT